MAFVGNVSMGGAGDLRAAIPKLIAGETPPAPAPDPAFIEVAPERLAPLAGRYLDPDGTAIVVRVDRGALWVSDGVVRPIADRRFFSPSFRIEIEFSGEPEAAKEMRMRIPGQPRVYPRIDP